MFESGWPGNHIYSLPEAGFSDLMSVLNLEDIQMPSRFDYYWTFISTFDLQSEKEQFVCYDIYFIIT